MSVVFGGLMRGFAGQGETPPQEVPEPYGHVHAAKRAGGRILAPFKETVSEAYRTRGLRMCQHQEICHIHPTSLWHIRLAPNGRSAEDMEKNVLPRFTFA